jgi:hypothetical protein
MFWKADLQIFYQFVQYAKGNHKITEEVGSSDIRVQKCNIFKFDQGLIDCRDLKKHSSFQLQWDIEEISMCLFTSGKLGSMHFI